jgi:CRP-like cAMP-binding protein
MSIQTLKAREILFEQGDIGDSFYIIYYGKVGVYSDELDKNTGEKSRVFKVDLNQGKCFGEKALIYGEKRSATIIAAEPTDLIVLDKMTYDRIIKGA